MHIIPTDDAPNVIAIRLDRKIEGDDMRAIRDRVEEITGRGRKVRVYVEMDGFPKLTWEALKEDLGMGFEHFGDFERKAVVTDMAWTEHLAKIANALFPSIEARRFAPEEKDQAMAWVKE